MNGATRGIHHITAIAGDPGEILTFYTQVLGLRLVKRTVNFDDPGTWHLYLGDRIGSPGTILTFFPLGPDLPRGTAGSGSVGSIAFSAPAGSFEYWTNRMATAGVPIDSMEERFGEKVISFKDPDGLRLELVFQHSTYTGKHWAEGPVEKEYSLAGIHSAALTVDNAEQTSELLTGELGFGEQSNENGRIRLSTGGDGPGTVIELVSDRAGSYPRMGPGTVHHIAFRTENLETQADLSERLGRLGMQVTGVRDRSYFHSIYFREPGGVLFEIATDGPGFASDEPVESLGEQLMLPPQFEPRREAIIAALPELQSGDQVGSGSVK